MQRKKVSKVLIVIIAILAVAAVLAIMILPDFKARYDANKELAVQNAEAYASEGHVAADGNLSKDLEKWQEGFITYNGKEYKYNSKIKTILFMGIDSDEPVAPAKDFISGGQSDAMFLLVDDPTKQQFSIIAIHRNTMTDIKVFDREGKELGNQIGQICLQHGYGDGMKLSCRLSTEAASKMFYNLPISGYMAVQMGAIGYMNDGVGGVEVEVLDDIDRGDVHLKKGQKVKLTGDEAYAYLRSRDLDEFDSSSTRLERQKQWLSQFFVQFKSASTNQLNQMYEDMEPYMVRDIILSDLVDNVKGYDMELYTIKGETVLGEDGFEEHYIDEDDFYNTIIEVFYEEVNDDMKF